MKQQKTPLSFMGQYAAQLSRRGSFRLPAAFCRKLLAEGDGKRRLYFFRLEGVLCIYSAEGLPERMRQVTATQEKGIARFLWAQTAEAELSRCIPGRVVIPPRLLEASGLDPGDKLALLGAMDHVEVWPAQAWVDEMRGMEQDSDFKNSLDNMLR